LSELLFLLVDKVGGELCWSAVIKLVDNFDSLVEESDLFFLNFCENCDTGWWVNKLHAVHFIEELFNGILLFQLMEADNCLFPFVVVRLKLFLI
jgi:hypothetical protein